MARGRARAHHSHLQPTTEARAGYDVPCGVPIYQLQLGEKSEEVTKLARGRGSCAPIRTRGDTHTGVRAAVRPGEEQVLGWRPAVGGEMPDAPNWIISKKLGEGGFGEVWLADHNHELRTVKIIRPERFSNGENYLLASFTRR